MLLGVNGPSGNNAQRPAEPEVVSDHVFATAAATVMDPALKLVNVRMVLVQCGHNGRRTRLAQPHAEPEIK